MFFLNFTLVQDVAAAAAKAQDVEKISIFDIIMQSGTMGIINASITLLLSLIAVYIAIERWLTLNKAAKMDDNFINNIRANVASGNIEAAKVVCRNYDSPMARMVEKGLQRIGKPLRDIDAAVENVGNLEIFKLEKNLSLLATISGAAPMIGFLGTVTGMIQAFYSMATSANVTPALLAGGIYQALITTALGLVVGIFALAAYNILVSKVEKVIFQMERTSTDFLDLLQEPTH